LLNHILAKSTGETLIHHTETIIKYWNNLKSQYIEILPVDDLFWELSFLSVLFHDTGKIALNFQEKNNGIVNHWEDYIRHEFLSGLLLLFSGKEIWMRNPLPLLAIFSHHKPLVTSKIFIRERNRTLRVEKEDLEILARFLNAKIKDDTIRVLPQIVEEFSQKRSLEPFYLLFRKFMDEKGVKFNPESRINYIFYKAILNTADWSASSHSNISTKLENFNEAYLRKKTIEKLLEEGKKEIAENFQWKDFQNKCLAHNGHVLAIAPTGSGKTEASLLWASKKLSSEKIIYLLPTRVTSNSIYMRLKGYFGNDKTAVIHSSAFFYRKELNENFTKKDYLTDKTFFKNVNICTIDQVLTQGFNLGFWEIKTFHMLSARVVIDEIHLYAPYTLGLIVSTIKYLKENFGTKFFIMTATMPMKLQTLLQQTLGISEKETVRDKELLSKARNIFEVRDCLVDDLDIEIVKTLETGKKILIVVNTVDEAIRLFNKYDGIAERTICYHSRFIQKDRLKKEIEILEFEKKATSFLLIATQVVEVSLDIDFDFLFSENAPMEAIIQRAGRVNRKRNKDYDTKVIIFKEQQVTREVIYTDVENILENTFNEFKSRSGQKITENELIKMVDSVYENYNVKSHPSYLEGLDKYFEIQRKHHFIKDNIEYGKVYTREGLDSINIIPSKFYEHLKVKMKFEDSEMAKHELSIRIKKLYALKNEFQYHIEGFYHFIGCKYSYEVGLELNKADNNTLNF